MPINAGILKPNERVIIMAANTIESNTPTSWQVVTSSPVHIALAGQFDGAVIALEQRIHKNTYPVLDDTQAPIVYVSAFDDVLNLNEGDLIRLAPTGGGGALAVEFNIAGAGIYRG